MKKSILSLLLAFLSIAVFSQHQWDSWTTASGTNTYAVTVSVPTLANLSTKNLHLKFANTNTNASTLNVTPLGSSALGAIQIRKSTDGGATWVALTGGEIIANVKYDLAYNGSYFELYPNLGGGGAGSQDLQDVLTNGSTAAITTPFELESSDAITIQTTGTGKSFSLINFDGGGLTITDVFRPRSGGHEYYWPSVPPVSNGQVLTSQTDGLMTWEDPGELYTFSPPLSETAGTVSIPQANGSTDGFLDNADWSTFNNKQSTISVSAPITLTGASIGMVNQGTTTTVLHGNASGNPTFGAVSLTADVSGDLPLSNLAQGTARSVLGVAGNSTADYAPIQGTADQILKVNSAGTALAFESTTTAATFSKVDDTNVTATLSGNTSSLVNAMTFTLGWTGTLAPARGGTGTGTAFTTGSLVFSGSSGVYAQDNTNLFFDNTNDRLGIGTATPNSRLQVSGSAAFANTSITTTTTLDATHYAVYANATSGAITVNLPALSGVIGRVYIIKKSDASGNAVTIDGNSTETIDGSATLALGAQYDYVTIQAITGGWMIIGRN